MNSVLVMLMSSFLVYVRYVPDECDLFVCLESMKVVLRNVTRRLSALHVVTMEFVTSES